MIGHPLNPSEWDTDHIPVRPDARIWAWTFDRSSCTSRSLSITEWTMKRTLLSLLLSLVVAPTTASADGYLNCETSEPAIDSSPATLFCDDFEDGTWYVSRNNPEAAENDGWLGFSGDDPTGGGWAHCTSGAAATNCATSKNGQNLSGNGPIAFHGLKGYTSPGSGVDELWIRYYIYIDPDVSWCYNMKVGPTLNRCTGRNCRDTAGIDFGSFGIAWAKTDPSPKMGCQNDSGCGTLGQNNCAGCGSPIDYTPGHWHYIELHVKLGQGGGYTGAPGSTGVFEMWFDDCGPNGDQCSGTPTKRAYYDKVDWFTGIGGDNSALIGTFQLEDWTDQTTAECRGQGERRFDQYVVSKTGPIGFYEGGDGTPLPPPPARPAPPILLDP